MSVPMGDEYALWAHWINSGLPPMSDEALEIVASTYERDAPMQELPESA